MSLLSPPLVAFLAVTRLRTVRAAASELGITQTGVTQRIRALEGGLGSALFTRSRRGMMLTGEGEALLRYCQAARELEGEALARIQGGGVRAEVRFTLTGPTSILRSRVIPACEPVMRKYPELLATFRISDAAGALDELRAGTAQLAVVPRDEVPKEMDSKVLKPERYVLIAPRAWRGRTLADIVRRERIIDFDATDRMTHAYLKRFGVAGLARAERHFVNNTESLAELIQAGRGYGVLAHDFARRFLQRCDLTVINEGKAFEHGLALAWYPRPRRAGYWQDLIGAIR